MFVNIGEVLAWLKTLTDMVEVDRESDLQPGRYWVRSASCIECWFAQGVQVRCTLIYDV